MYKCEICGNTSKPRTQAHKIIIQTRRTTFPLREKAFACWKQEGNRRKFVRPNDPGGTGKQIVKEVVACRDCAKRLAEQENESEFEDGWSQYVKRGLAAAAIQERAPPIFK